VAGLFSGALASVFRDAPYAGIYVASYERLKLAAQRLLDESPRLSSSVPLASINFGAALLGGCTATLTTQPFDVIKTRVQVQPAKYPSFSRAVALIWSEQGLPGYFRGVMPRIVRKSLMTASTWTIYEELLRRVNTP